MPFPDLENAAALISARGSQLGSKLHVLAKTTSTNDEAKHAAKQGAAHGECWVAEEQDAGRGRQGRAWISPPGENLLFSVLLRIPCPNEHVPTLAIAAGLAVCDVAATYVNDAVRVKLKWPNDVLVDKKKLAGILVESTFSRGLVESIIVGIGLNVHTREFPPELADIATSLALAGAGARDARELNRGEILADLLARLDHDLTHVAGRGLGIVHARLTKLDALKGQRISTESGEGIADGIDLEGRLVLKKDDGTICRIFSGEVHIGTRAHLRSV